MAEDDFFLAIRQFQSADFDCSKNREVAMLKSALFPWAAEMANKLEYNYIAGDLPLLLPGDAETPWSGTNLHIGQVKRVRLDTGNHHQHRVDTLDCMESFPAPNPDANYRLNQSLMVISDDDDESLSDTGLDHLSSSSRQKQTTISYAPIMESTFQQGDLDEPSKLHVKGEHRLRIQFLDLGTSGQVPQRFGKMRCGIPDGLCGTTHVYDQHWRFRVSHVVTSTGVRIKWKIENLASGLVSEVIESDNDSRIRCRSGRTICNVVLKKAFDMRAQELEKELETVEKDSSKYGKIQNLIQALRPTRCTVGLLFFGLLHECVQQKWEAEVRNLEG